MDQRFDTLNKEFEQGCRLKEIARKDTNHLDVFLEAANHMQVASTLAFKIADDSSCSANERLVARVFGLYYSAEHHSCTGNYHYEKRDTGKSKQHQEKGLKALSEAINLVDTAPNSISHETLRELKDHLPVWRYIQKADKASVLASDARGAWDAGSLVDALDLYREAAKIQLEAISMADRDNLPLPYKRIATGNYIGMMANASNALAQIILQKGTIGYSGPTKLLSSEAAIDLMRYASDTYRLGKLAFDENPEWDQYRELANVSMRNIQNFLSDNKSSWLEFYLALEHDEEFKRIMKMTDLQEYKDVELERLFRQDKTARLWLIGSFWIFAVTAITALVMYVTRAGLSWWQLLLALSAIETVLLVIIASTLRSLGDLSEERFLKLIRVALRYQLKVFRLSRKQKDQSQGNGT